MATAVPAYPLPAHGERGGRAEREAGVPLQLRDLSPIRPRRAGWGWRRPQFGAAAKLSRSSSSSGRRILVPAGVSLQQL